MSELQIVDRPEERKLSRIGPQNRWWDFVWGKLVSLLG